MAHADRRLTEAAKFGLSPIIVARGESGGQPLAGTVEVATLREALTAAFGTARRAAA
ncbi:MAG: hypothetical protein NTV40_08305 [Solirubrobacterales bacterium]|nr:hypothetical protein [Solirubrobacterales bacterium]